MLIEEKSPSDRHAGDKYRHAMPYHCLLQQQQQQKKRRSLSPCFNGGANVAEARPPLEGLMCEWKLFR
jgi:hypothetical protein